MQPTKIKDVFDIACKNLNIDNNLVKKLERFKIEFITKNKDHAEFFGGNLTGCYNVKFTPSDRDKIFYDILQIDEKDVDKDNDKFIPKKHYNVAGDNANLALVWLTHAIRKSNLPEKDKRNAESIAMEILQYKFYTSRLWVHWRYQCSIAESEATLAALNNKFIIKQKGSWNKVFRDRGLEITDPVSSIHKDTINEMKKDITLKGDKGPSVAYLLTDTQSRIRDMLKNIFDVFLKVHDSGRKITSQSKISVFEGEKSFKDDTNIQSKLNQYLHSIIVDKNSFIKSDLADLIIKTLPTMSPKLFFITLDYLSDKYTTHDNSIKDLLDKTLEHCITYLSVNNELRRNQNDISFLLSKMKGIYSSSRSQDPLLIEVRDLMEKIVKEATRSKVPAQIAATRSGVLLYILLRVFTMNYYSN